MRNGEIVGVEQQKDTAFAHVRNVVRSCIMKWSDEPVKPLGGSPVGVHTSLCLGRRSLCFFEGGKGIGFFEPQAMLVNS